jgi:hypothetical protein
MNCKSWNTARQILLGTVMMSVAWIVRAQESPFTTVPFDSSHWTLTGTAADMDTVVYLGQRALRIHSGAAQLKGVDFGTGTIAFDIAFQPDAEFAGIYFREKDLDNTEYFYLRPHRSGYSDSNQYIPMMNGDDPWQIYSGPEFGSTETYKFGGWNHVQIQVYPKSADVFINGARSLRIPELKGDASRGSLALFVRAGTTNTVGQVIFSNFRYSSMNNQTPEDMPKPQRFAPVGLIQHWLVAPAMSEDEANRRASQSNWSGTAWTPLSVETNGIANLSRLNGTAEGRDFTIARYEIQSDSNCTKLLKFGYSDKLTLYLNGAMVYRGDNSQYSRDPRFLGIVGLFDTISVPLHRGLNNLAFVVEEKSGGWAAEAQFLNVEGLLSAAF